MDVDFFSNTEQYEFDSERAALVDVEPKGMIIRHPPKPHELDTDITHDDKLFQTIHMGAAVVDPDRWRLVVDGLVERPFSLSLGQLKAMPISTITTFHECYGSPLKPPTTPLWRIGSVQWTGVRLSALLEIARPSEEAKFVWSEGLEHGRFATIEADRYQKDLPIEKALQPEVLIAYELNGKELSKERGFPVRLIVPGWFGTNSTKWLCRLSIKPSRAPGPFTTKLYNEIDPHDPDQKRMRPVWAAEVNSMICRPKPGDVLETPDVLVWGKAWGCEEVANVEVSVDQGVSWISAELSPRKQFEWQRFDAKVALSAKAKKHSIMARATDKHGIRQPLSGRRNHVHSVEVDVR